MDKFIFKPTGKYYNKPVFALDGHIYESDYINGLFYETKGDEIISPITNQPIKKFVIYPQEFCELLSKFYKNHPELEILKYVTNEEIGLPLFHKIIQEKQPIGNMLNYIYSRFKEVAKPSNEQERKIFNKCCLCFDMNKNEELEYFKLILNNEIGIEYYLSGYFIIINSEHKYTTFTLIQYSNHYNFYIESLINNIDLIKQHFYYACYYGKYELMEKLYEVNNDVDIINYIHNSVTIMSAAIIGGNLDIIKFIHNIDNTLYTKSSIFDPNYLAFACIKGKLDIVKWFHSIDNTLYEKYIDHSPFYFACVEGHNEIVQYLYSIDKYIYDKEFEKKEIIELLNKNNFKNILQLIQNNLQ